ncbi:hypothetical protein Pmar_PMAR018536 [Perkinsus marinus ATCC 50983]|uniref:Uncharacterized protein n=1 Tax=Perkinsus marinus (strain ATCC 50983 / TXsc) TaxID=423536 RepID=C5L034_PERM5|nr:hypothetical protein Pmar_PMAR018536 [Perkinsus marinus ATCC 50983]EER09892.1 hypothetical protein Pmar_PMAR018536 [Perkinsus marinus ATCC 50983]|eukprot:XP_002778097.1 hypothetical protein Pmar_PMAR018536 [Perkinsus marinus ATCC 50983]
MMRLLSSFFVLGSVAAADWNYCQELCEETPGCKNYGWGSYCKGNGVCFGLLDMGGGDYCFEPTDGFNGGYCSDKVYSPVSCPVVDKTCEDLCAETPKCKNSKWGSYCKKYVDQPGPYVCFGLYNSDKPHLCYEPSEGDKCDESSPVYCPSEMD